MLVRVRTPVGMWRIPDLSPEDTLFTLRSHLIREHHIKSHPGMYVYVERGIYVCRYIYMYIYIYIYTYSRVYIYIYMYICVCIHTYVEKPKELAIEAATSTL